MRYVCDAPGGRTWFSFETQAEADAESELMAHAVSRHFERATEMAKQTYQPRPGLERDIGLKDHIARTAPLFLTLRDPQGAPLATAMLPQKGSDVKVRPIIVGPHNADPYPDHADAIAALGARLGMKLPRDACFPYA